MNVGSKYDPVGFIKVAAPVNQVQWSPARFVSTSELEQTNFQ